MDPFNNDRIHVVFPQELGPATSILEGCLNFSGQGCEDFIFSCISSIGSTVIATGRYESSKGCGRVVNASAGSVDSYATFDSALLGDLPASGRLGISFTGPESTKGGGRVSASICFSDE